MKERNYDKLVINKEQNNKILIKIIFYFTNFNY